jgi:hypothetical protein
MSRQRNEWCISSNDGWNEIIFEAQVLHRKTDVVEYSVYMTGKRSYPSALEVTPSDHARVVDDYIIKLPAIAVSMSVCNQLMTEFDAWLDNNTPFERHLTTTSERIVTLELGTRNDLITTANHPAVTFRYDDGRCRLEVFFVVDQSCIRIAREGLATALGPFLRLRP